MIVSKIVPQFLRRGGQCDSKISESILNILQVREQKPYATDKPKDPHSFAEAYIESRALLPTGCSLLG